MGIMTKAVGGITGCRRFLPRTELCIWLTQLAAQTQEHDDDDDDDDDDDIYIMVECMCVCMYVTKK